LNAASISDLVENPGAVLQSTQRQLSGSLPLMSVFFMPAFLANAIAE
jgi:hypothetical protein